MTRLLVAAVLTCSLLAAPAAAHPGATTPAVGAPVAGASQPRLSVGVRGGAVSTLQQRLATLGFNPGPVDGIFGPRTRAAVLAFQRARGLAVDGVVGPITWGALGSAPAASAPAAPAPAASPAASPAQPRLRYGARGTAVRTLQERLATLGFSPGPVDGIFGSRTRAAVLAFQRARRVAVDGIVGPVTWGALGSAPAAPTAPAASPAPSAPAVSGGPSLATWDALARCESGGRWDLNTGNGYYGGLQFLPSTWRGVGGTGLPHQASKEEQIARATILWERYGWKPWPACTRKLGLR